MKMLVVLFGVLCGFAAAASDSVLIEASKQIQEDTIADIDTNVVSCGIALAALIENKQATMKTRLAAPCVVLETNYDYIGLLEQALNGARYTPEELSLMKKSKEILEQEAISYCAVTLDFTKKNRDFCSSYVEHSYEGIYN